MSVKAMAQVLAWYESMVRLYAVMTEKDREDLHAWESENLSRTVASSDWPGWSRLGLPTMDGAAIAQLRSERRGVAKAQIPTDVRWAVWERDDFTCQHCGVRRYLSVDHIVPESKSGELVMSNLQTLCRSCNSRKGTG